MNNLRILLIGSYPPPYGGIASHLKSLVPSLVSRNFGKVIILSFSNKNNNINNYVGGARFFEFIIKKNIHLLFKPSSLLLICYCLYYLNIFKIGFQRFLNETISAIIANEIANEYDVSIVSIYHSTSLMTLPLAKYWGNKRKIVLTVFGEVYGSSKFMIKNKKLIKKIIDSVTSVVSSSCHCADSFQKIGIKRNIQAVYYGVDLEVNKSTVKKIEFRNHFKIEQSSTVLLFMGRFLVDMGLDVILSIANNIFEYDKNIVLILAGASGELSEKAKAISILFPKNILIFQDVSFELQKDIYNASDILLAPSFDQRACMGIAIKEAMSYSMPVIGAAGGGVKEAIIHNETGLLIELDKDGKVNKNQLLESIKLLSGNKKIIENMGIKGRERVEQIFSVNTTNEKMINIFYQSLEKVDEK